MWFSLTIDGIFGIYNNWSIYFGHINLFIGSPALAFCLPRRRVFPEIKKLQITEELTY